MPQSTRAELLERAAQAAVGGDTEAALVPLMEILRRSPDDIEALVLKGHVFEMRNWIAQARVIYERVLAVDDANIDAIIGLGDCARADGDLAAALGWFQQARDRVETDLSFDRTSEAVEDILFGQYTCLIELGRSEEAGRIVVYGQTNLPASETIATIVRDWEKRDRL